MEREKLDLLDFIEFYLVHNLLHIRRNDADLLYLLGGWTMYPIQYFSTRLEFDISVMRPLEKD